MAPPHPFLFVSLRHTLCILSKGYTDDAHPHSHPHPLNKKKKREEEKKKRKSEFGESVLTIFGRNTAGYKETTSVSEGVVERGWGVGVGEEDNDLPLTLTSVPG